MNERSRNTVAGQVEFCCPLLFFLFRLSLELRRRRKIGKRLVVKQLLGCLQVCGPQLAHAEPMAVVGQANADIMAGNCRPSAP